jgi:gamma-glutamylcyclotransferase (GGCT)/AIG2-like uncharacterized protein YtfP
MTGDRGTGPTDIGPSDVGMSPDRALAVYGTLAPGESNHGQVADIDGRWIEAAIRGERFTARWRDTPGYPAFVPDPAADPVPILVLVADELPDHWDRLDAFEGPGYRRIEIDVLDRAGARTIGRACVYQTLPDVWD